jgi:hypothetical protein
VSDPMNPVRVRLQRMHRQLTPPTSPALLELRDTLDAADEEIYWLERGAVWRVRAERWKRAAKHFHRRAQSYREKWERGQPYISPHDVRAFHATMVANEAAKGPLAPWRFLALMVCCFLVGAALYEAGASPWVCVFACFCIGLFWPRRRAA